MQLQTKTMRILAVSDTESEYIWDHFDESRFEGVDLMISCGDLAPVSVLPD